MSRWTGLRVLVAGIGVSGRAAALALAAAGARVAAVDERAGDRERDAAASLRSAGVAVTVGRADALPAGTGLVVTSPGWRPEHPLLAAAAAAGLPVIGEVELAWLMRPPGAAPWLAVTGTNGKTTTVGMLAAMLTAAGLRAAAVGNVGVPVVAAVRADPPPDVLAVELSSFQLHWAPSVRPLAGALLNLAEDHLDWHGGFERYAAAKERVWAGGLAIGNVDDPRVAQRLAAWAERRGGRTVGVSLGVPGPGRLGVEDGLLVDRAFERAGLPLAAAASVRPSGSHHVSNALAAAALARAYGVPAAAVAAGLAATTPGPHRGELVARVDGVDYVDDSKATNPHAAAAALGTRTGVVWIVGGLLKGADPAPAVLAGAGRLRAAVVIGRTRGPVLDALARHAPGIPVREVVGTDTGAMDEAVRAAAAMARRGDTVLLAPAAASMDMFRDYAERGAVFAAAVRRLPGAAG